MVSRLESHLRGLRVLVVEDDDDSRDLFVAILEQCGAAVSAAASAHEALEVLQQAAANVVVSDISMPPGEDGYWLARKIKDLTSGGPRDVQLLAVTAHSREHGRERALSAGFREYLTKPVDPSLLCRTVESLVGQAGTSREM